MVEFNFCPQCATAKIGRFCAGCGTNLDQLTALFAQLAPAPAATAGRYAASEPEAPASASTTAGLVYGESYDPDKDCANCGSPATGGECALCSAV